jgi:nitrite reductase/ring-hydroxylating ferredoxin subunit
MNPEPELTDCANCRRSAKWRQDFPIEWDGDHYVSRREMVKFLTLGSLLLASANWITVVAAKLTHRGSRAELLIGPMSKLKANGSMLFRYPTEQDPCIAVRTPEGRIVAYSQVCTHLSCAVIYDKSEGALFCPCHHGLFNLEGQPLAGPPTRPLPRITVEQRGDQLYATGMEG